MHRVVPEMACCAEVNDTTSTTDLGSVPGKTNVKSFDAALVAETGLVGASIVLLVRVLKNSSDFAFGWLLVPSLLLAVPLVLAVVKGKTIGEIALNFKPAKAALVLVFRTCLVLFPLLILFCCLLKLFGWGPALKPNVSARVDWLGWLLYQFMYIAVAEEMFFRGYLQGNILKITGPVFGGQSADCRWISIIISAALFALAHLVVQGQTISVLTFFPGLVLGWLFVRSGSLVAPILFHGLANTFYCWLVVLFT